MLRCNVASNFNNDLQQEQELGAFLDSYFYPYIGLPYTRISDMNSQFKGIDVSIYNGNRYIYIDEKGAMTYINKDISTFAFELSYKNTHNIIQQGWLLDKAKITDLYLLAWLRATKDYEITKDDITLVEAYIVSRSGLLKYLDENFGYSREKLLELDREVREGNQLGFSYVIGNVRKKGYKIMLSSHLAEQPVNIIISKELLREVASARYYITKNIVMKSY